MAPLREFPLPLPPRAPPAGYACKEYEHPTDAIFHRISSSSEFEREIRKRDTFLGVQRCVVCGDAQTVFRSCCIIGKSSEYNYYQWEDLVKRRYVPKPTSRNPKYEPRNRFLLCSAHEMQFGAYEFFIRFDPKTKKYIFVNYSNTPSLANFHGKAVALDIKDPHAPLPSLFIIHEMRVRGYHPFQPTTPDMPDDNDSHEGYKWQDWVYSDHVLDEATGSFKRFGPPPCPPNFDTTTTQTETWTLPPLPDDSDSDEERYRESFIRVGPPPCPPSVDTTQTETETVPQTIQFNNPTTDDTASSTNAPPEGTHKLVLNEDTINQILLATRQSASWRACEMENTSWSGTAEENTQRYLSSFGVEEEEAEASPSSPREDST